MATLAETIKSTGGLLAYWPLTDNTDQSGNGRHLTTLGAPTFGAPPLSTDGHPSVLTPDSGSTLRIAQSTLPKIRAIEGFFRLAGGKGTDYSTVFGLNQPATGFNSRFILLYGGSVGVCSYQAISPLGGNTFYKSLTKTWDELSYSAHHFVVQLNDAGTTTEVFIDGVKDPAMSVPMDVFLQIAGSYLTVGSFYYNGAVGTGAGNGQVSDMAIYDRPLTQTVITGRQQYKMPEPAFRLCSITTLAANQEPRSQFIPQDVTWRGTPTMYAGPVATPKISALAITKGRDLCWIRDGVQNVLQGYIRSTVTINGVGVRRRVLCFTQDGELVGETFSRAEDGVYQFDLLWLNRRYMVVAQDDPAYGPADYNAVAADYQAPAPYPADGSVVPVPFFQ
ncbi:LamG-like jellyroll fold domain-containing protein [Aeromonas dhakensis]|uniref:hypothetical protein n=1 Tax=Aeromonas dhakensis TaxID=196024 RepID=UPI000693DB6D|nr:hypothetical protein [Aeromonas dhakensis]